MELPHGTIDEKLEYMDHCENQHMVHEGIEIDVLTMTEVFRLHADAAKNGCVYSRISEWDVGQVDEIMYLVGILF